MVLKAKHYTFEVPLCLYPPCGLVLHLIWWEGTTPTDSRNAALMDVIDLNSEKVIWL